MRFSTDISISITDDISIIAFELALKSTKEFKVVRKSMEDNRYWYHIECDSLQAGIMFGKLWRFHEIELVQTSNQILPQ